MANRRGHAGKVDTNQTEIIEALRAMGVIVRSLAGIGDGMNDLLCAVPGELFLVEVKMPGEKLTPLQKHWHEECPWRNHIAYTVTEAIAIAGGYLQRKKKD